MSVDPVRAYQEAVSRRDAATSRVEKIVNIVQNAADALKDWGRTVVTNVPDQFPLELAREKFAPTINAKLWPTIEQLASALSEWHVAKVGVKNAWSAIPGDQCAGLQPP